MQKLHLQRSEFVQFYENRQVDVGAWFGQILNEVELE